MTLKNVFEEGGLLDSKIEDYEFRSEQLVLSEFIEKALENKESCVVEGATGIGKSFGYLIPLILKDKKVIVSTSNKNLQDQLNNKDLPTLVSVFGKKKRFSWVTLKGKNNYFCGKNFNVNESELVEKLGSIKIKKVVKWANKTKTGELDELPFELEKDVRDLMCCNDVVYHEEKDLCFHQKVKNSLDSVNIVLVNHTLLAFDLSLRAKSDNYAKILPDVDCIVLDEAHAFEDYATMAFSDKINTYSLRHFLNWNVVKDRIKYNDRENILKDFDKLLSTLTPKKFGTYYAQEEHKAIKGLDIISFQLERLVWEVKNHKMNKGDEKESEILKTVESEGYNLVQRLRNLSLEDTERICWVEAFDSKNTVSVSINTAPISIAKLLGERLFKEKDRSVICTSATLATNNSFDFFRQRLGVPSEAKELIVTSPFNYRSNSLVYLSDGSMDPLKEVANLIEESKGGAFILFTSYKDMQYFYQYVKTDYPKFIQSTTLSKQKLIEDFKASKNGVLFATKSFWEGIDIKGDQLKLVVIHKIPFSNISNLLYKKKLELIDKEFGKGASFMKFAVPEATLSLKQGVGRLIRSKNDVGVIALLDERILKSRYGSTIATAFPKEALRTSKMEIVRIFFDKKFKRE